MKIKKVNELKTSGLSEEELNNWRLEEFNSKNKYKIWAEYLDDNNNPWYDLLKTFQTLDQCADYYNNLLHFFLIPKMTKLVDYKSNFHMVNRWSIIN